MTKKTNTRLMRDYPLDLDLSKLSKQKASKLYDLDKELANEIAYDKKKLRQVLRPGHPEDIIKRHALQDKWGIVRNVEDSSNG